MDDSGFPPNSMDFDYMDELLLDGCWLQATDNYESSNNNFDPSFPWPILEVNNDDPLPKNVPEGSQISHFSVNLSNSPTQNENSSKTHVNNLLKIPNQLEDFQSEGSDSSRRWWIAPRANPGPSLSVMERLVYAIANIKHYTVDKNLLIQVWIPEDLQGKKVLSTSQQLFSLELNCPRLSNYRNISENYHFSAEGDSKDSVGLPGRVFKGKVPEWTPDVRFFKREEYPRVSHAKRYDVRGSVAVPIFDQDSSCLGVFEVLMTTQKSNYSLEIQSVCQALEAVNLRSSEASQPEEIKASNDDSYQAALPEILAILKAACETYNLPLAQTWILCTQQGKGGCRHSDENLIHCISTVDSACYVSDPRFKDFHEACSYHHLLKGQGVVGQAFMTNQPCFSSDVTSYTKTEYPLSHHARISDLHGAVAIRLKSTYTPLVDYVLEFFLPVDCKDKDDQKGMLDSLSTIIQKVCRSLRIVTEEELKEEELSGVFDREEQVPKVKGKEMLDFVTKEANNSGLQGESSVGNESNKKVEKRRASAKTDKTITLQMLRQHFAGSLKDAAKNIGVCPTTLKRICRQHGIQRWPSRKIKKVGHSLQKIQLVMDSVHGAAGSFQIDSFYSNFPELASHDQSKSLPVSSSKVKIVDSKATTQGATTSHSHSSSSSQSCSSGTHIPAGEDSGQAIIEQTTIGTKLLGSNGQEPKSKSKSVNELSESQNLRITSGISRDENLFRLKVAYGEEKIRFRMQKDCGYSELQQEIAKRFGISDISGLSLKYFDDDCEWVLLTCDADLEECIDVCRMYKSNTIKLTLLEPQHRVGSSVGSNVPL